MHCSYGEKRWEKGKAHFGLTSGSRDIAMPWLPDVSPLKIAVVLQHTIFLYLHHVINTVHYLIGKDFGLQVLNGPRASIIVMTLEGESWCLAASP